MPSGQHRQPDCQHSLKDPHEPALLPNSGPHIAIRRRHRRDPRESVRAVAGYRSADAVRRRQSEPPCHIPTAPHNEGRRGRRCRRRGVAEPDGRSRRARSRSRRLVSRSVVDDENIHIRAREAQFADHPRQAVGFVVRRNHAEDRGPRSPSASSGLNGSRLASGWPLAPRPAACCDPAGWAAPSERAEYTR